MTNTPERPTVPAGYLSERVAHLGPPAAWPQLLGIAIITNQRLATLQPDSHVETLPRLKCPELHLQAFESSAGERFPKHYRDFLLHADGWEGCFGYLDVFGLPEQRGGGNGAPAQLLLHHFDQCGLLDRIDLDPNDVIPVAGGHGQPLVIMTRSTTTCPGRVYQLDLDVPAKTFADFRAWFHRTLTARRRRSDLPRSA